MKKMMTRLMNNFKKEDGWGIAEVLTAIVGVVVVVLIMAPAIKGFSTEVSTALTTWWDGINAALFSA